MAEPAAGQAAPVARSPIRSALPVVVSDGWEVSARRSTAALRLTDVTPLAKVLVLAGPDAGEALGVPCGRAARDGDGALVVGVAPGEWLLVAAPGAAARVAALVRAATGAQDAMVSVLDVTHGRALVRLTGERSAALLAKVCAIDLGDRTTPDGAALRTSVARVVTEVVREDVNRSRSYLLGCDRALGAYLFDALRDAGAEFGVDIDGFPGR